VKLGQSIIKTFYKNIWQWLHLHPSQLLRGAVILTAVIYLIQHRQDVDVIISALGDCLLRQLFDDVLLFVFPSNKTN
jgi:hypothetical protein